jgi:hypothetical protein
LRLVRRRFRHPHCDYPLEYYDDGYPELPECLKRNCGILLNSLSKLEGMMNMGKYQEGFATASNLAKWQDYAHKNSYVRDTAQTKRDLNPQKATTAADFAPNGSKR